MRQVVRVVVVVALVVVALAVVDRFQTQADETPTIPTIVGGAALTFTRHQSTPRLHNARIRPPPPKR